MARWGDEAVDEREREREREREDERDRERDQGEDEEDLLRPFETAVDENGMKTTYEYVRRDGEVWKVVRKVQVREVVKRTHRDVERRKRWAKVRRRLNFCFLLLYFFCA